MTTILSLYSPLARMGLAPKHAMAVCWTAVEGGVTAPQGFQASGITAGLKASGRPDLALLVAPEGAVCAGTFTTSVVRAACVDLCRDRLVSTAGWACAVLINPVRPMPAPAIAVWSTASVPPRCWPISSASMRSRC